MGNRKSSRWLGWLAGIWLAIVAAQAWAGAPGDSAISAADLEAARGDPEGRLVALRADVERLKRHKLSGYVQARWETTEDQSDTVRVEGFPATATPANRGRFFIRRARLKLTYDPSPLSQGVLYLDGGQEGAIRLLEAYVTLRDPWTRDHRHELTLGQMNVPFGYEIERSSSARELPERSRAENALFPGERDRGLKLVSRWTPGLETVVGVFNGGGVKHPDFPDTDPTRAKDLLGRVRWSGEALAAAVSGYSGKATTPLTGDDLETDKTRFGLDGQLRYRWPAGGDGALVGELYRGKNLNPDSVKALTLAPTSSNPVTLLQPGADRGHFATEFVGGYVMCVQDLGARFQAAARYDLFDPNTEVEHDRFERTSLGLNYFHDRATRVTVAYDIPRTERALGGGRYADPKDNLWTIQFQHRF